MVEGHSVHRVAHFHRQRLVGKAFEASSPNGRFSAGAAAINGKVFQRIEAVGKNLFAFFGNHNSNDSSSRNTCSGNKNDDNVIVVHIHFGMAGAWAVYESNSTSTSSSSASNSSDEEPIIVPEPSKTCRLRLQGHGMTADLSAMTVNYYHEYSESGMNFYEKKRAQLGQDPLRDDADPEVLWNKVWTSRKSIGALIMDQSYFTGPGNIYRAEILFKAGVHPDTPGCELTRYQFDTIWQHTVELLRRGFETGSILTVDPEEAVRLGNPDMRRYIYNTRHCPRCGSNIQTWQINKRTCYACPQCQPRHHHSANAAAAATVTTPTAAVAAVTPEPSSRQHQRDHVPFNSHCARESVETRLAETGPSRLTVTELKEQLTQRSILYPKNAKKGLLVQLLTAACSSSSASTTKDTRKIASSEAAAVEKAQAQESLAVEHIAELAPAQARRARRLATTVSIDVSTPKKRKATTSLVTPKRRRSKRKTTTS